MRGVMLILALTALPASAAIADGTFHLSSGRTIDLPPVAGLNCAALSGKLSEIDGTGYRGTSPEPRNAADLPLLAYEEEVATAYYRGCVVSALGRRTPSAAFTEGYRGKN